MSEKQNTGISNIRLMMSLIFGVFVGVVGVGYSLWSYFTVPEKEVSHVNLTRMTGTAQVSAQEQPAYRELLRESNSRGAQSAANSNKSFIASIPLQEDVVTPKESAKVAAVPAPAPVESPRPHNIGRTQEQEKLLNEARQKSLATLLAKMQAPPSANLSVAQVLGGKESGWASWRDSLPVSYIQQTVASSRQDTSNATSAAVVVAPYWRGPGEIYTGVNSDNGTTPVLGRITTGKYDGAVLKAPEGAKLSGDGVIIHFTTMALHGQNYKVDAYALQDDTLVANIATDVDHHYIRRIVLPSFFGGLGSAGQLYAQANTQLLSNGFNSITARPATPDGTAVAGVIAGGTMERASQVLTNDASRLPDRTVRVDNGEVVAIQFMRGVYSTDVESPQGAMPTAVNAASPAALTNNRKLTAADLRAETQARIRAAEQRGNARD